MDAKAQNGDIVEQAVGFAAVSMYDVAMAGDTSRKNGEKTQYRPGESGNSNGRPTKGETMTDILKAQGEIEDQDFNGEKIARKVALGHKTWALALKGKEATIRYLYDRIDGKPVQEIKVRSDVPLDAPIIIVLPGGSIESEGEASIDEMNEANDKSDY